MSPRSVSPLAKVSRHIWSLPEQAMDGMDVGQELLCQPLLERRHWGDECCTKVWVGKAETFVVGAAVQLF